MAEITGSHGTPKRILVVDDNRDAADSVAQSLTNKDNQADTVYGSTDAPEHVLQHVPAVVLLDLGMW